MVQEIRKEALRQIHGRTAPQAWHPDSFTGITQSAPREQEPLPAREMSFAMSVADTTPIQNDLRGNSAPSGALSLSRFQETMMIKGETALQHETLGLHNVEEIVPCSLLLFEDPVSDSDDSGGVLL
jgi:hypothetical protein